MKIQFMYATITNTGTYIDLEKPYLFKEHEKEE